MTTLQYYYENGSHVIFEKYTVDPLGIIRNKISRKIRSYYKNGEYNSCSVYTNTGGKRKILVGRALASTFIGKPPTPKHTADHKDRNPNNDTLDNIRWLCKSGQNDNRTVYTNNVSAFLIVRDDIEKSAKEWVVYLQNEKNHMGRVYVENMIRNYARQKQHGFAYKEYHDLPGEIWKRIPKSDNSRGRWEISDMNRVKYVTKYAENVLSGDRLCLDNDGYPQVSINNRHMKCHIISFSIFFPNEYVTKKPGEIILHEDDDRLDFRPYKLRLGSKTENGEEAHRNGCYVGKKNERMACASYINGVLEKEHISQEDAARYLRSSGRNNKKFNGISDALKAYRDGKVIIRYGRTWKLI